MIYYTPPCMPNLRLESTCTRPIEAMGDIITQCYKHGVKPPVRYTQLTPSYYEETKKVGNASPRRFSK